MHKAHNELILASKSKARRTLLQNAGLAFTSVPAEIDERALEENFSGSPKALALKLAKQKALAVSKKHANAWVIGADQILEHEGKILHKAQTAQEAKDKLMFLKGKTHHLISAAAIAESEKIIWEHSDSASLKMCDFEQTFLDTYMENAGEALTKSVGAYELEAHGAWLFDEIKGDYFTILGLPLLPLLGFLRKHIILSP